MSCDEWLLLWLNMPHDGLRDPEHPGRAFTPNEKYAALVEIAGYVPVALGPDDYVELLPAEWRAVNAYGIKLNWRLTTATGSARSGGRPASRSATASGKSGTIHAMSPASMSAARTAGSRRSGTT